MLSFKDWLEGHEKTIKKGVINGRGFKYYLGRILESEDVSYIFKPRSRPQIKTRNNATIIEIPSPDIISIEPKIINFRLPNDWRRLFEEKVIVLLGNIISEIRKEEDISIIQTLTNKAEEIELDNEFSNLNEAIEIIESNEGYPDTMLVSFLKLRDLMKMDDFIPYFHLPETFVKNKGIPHFLGMFRHIFVYGSRGLEETEGILYDKSETLLKITPLHVSFNNYENPEVLEIYEKLYAWSYYDGMVVKLKF